MLQKDTDIHIESIFGCHAPEASKSLQCLGYTNSEASELIRSALDRGVIVLGRKLRLMPNDY